MLSQISRSKTFYKTFDHAHKVRYFLRDPLGRHHVTSLYMTVPLTFGA